jgi:NTE family protein
MINRGKHRDVSGGTVPVSLVLGSGGARGLAHIGVIRALREHGRYQIASITGSSIGALIGGLHAVGKLDAYAEWVSGLTRGDVWSLLDFSFTREGLFEGEKLMRKLDEMIGNVHIEDLPLPFTAIASDIDRRQEVWLNRGSLSKAIRASIAIPGLFTPVEYDGRLLVDGGLLSPLPLAPAQYQGSKQTIAVSLNGPDRDGFRAASEEEQPTEDARPPGMIGRWIRRAQDGLGMGTQAGRNDAFGIMAKSLEAMQDRIARFQVAAYRPGVLIEIPADACSVLDFHVADTMIELGYRRARATLGAAGCSLEGASPVEGNA